MARLTRRERQALRNQQGDPTPPTWLPDPAEPYWQETFETHPDLSSTISDRVVRYERTNQLIEFAVILTVERGGAPEEVLCIDTCNHGTVHRHRNGNHTDDPETIATLDPDELESRHSDAFDECYDYWQQGNS